MLKDPQNLGHSQVWESKQSKPDSVKSAPPSGSPRYKQRSEHLPMDYARPVTE